MRDYAESAKKARYCASEGGDCYGCPSDGYEPCSISAVLDDTADAIEELLAKVPTWISVEERLPEDGDIVLVYWYNVHCCERDNFSVMRFRKGRTAEELKQADFFRSCDQWGNNKKPYDWSDTHGPLSLFGQDVTHWMPLPEAPKEGTE